MILVYGVIIFFPSVSLICPKHIVKNPLHPDKLKWNIYIYEIVGEKSCCTVQQNGQHSQTNQYRPRQHLSLARKHFPKTCVNAISVIPREITNIFVFKVCKSRHCLYKLHCRLLSGRSIYRDVYLRLIQHLSESILILYTVQWYYNGYYSTNQQLK